MEAPNRPPHYARTCAMIYGACIGVGLVLNLVSDALWIRMAGVFIATALPIWLTGYVFRAYDAEKRAYEEYLLDQKLSDADRAKIEAARQSNVNDNIRRYLEEQKQRKAQAAWWQFWV